MHPEEAALRFVLAFIAEKQHDGDWAAQAKKHLWAIDQPSSVEPVARVITADEIGPVVLATSKI